MFHATPCMMPGDSESDATDLEVSEIAHDFKNLLAGMRMFAELGLARLPTGSPAREMIEQVQGACAEAAEMCDTLVSAARHAGAGQHRERLDLSALVNGVAPLLAASISGATKLQFELSAAPTMIQADRVQIRQVLTNLVLNASQALKNRPGLVVVSTGTVDPDEEPCGIEFAGDPVAGRSVFLDVSDTGCGMDEATRVRLFEPFFTTKLTGQGLGMASVERIVAAHGGAIRVRSVPGAGTTIRVLFPCAERSETRLLPRREECSGNGRAGDSAAGTLLLVDDDRGVRMLAEVLLESRGWTVLTGDSGEEAVELLREHHDAISVVVLDMSMPGMDGAETLRRLRRLDPKLPAVVLSGSSCRELEGLFGEEAPDAFLSKPFAVDDLIRIIQAVRADREPHRPPLPARTGEPQCCPQF